MYCGVGIIIVLYYSQNCYQVREISAFRRLVYCFTDDNGALKSECLYRKLTFSVVACEYAPVSYKYSIRFWARYIKVMLEKICIGNDTVEMNISPLKIYEFLSLVCHMRVETRPRNESSDQIPICWSISCASYTQMHKTCPK